MNVNLVPTSSFRKEAKRLMKKYPSLKQELFELANLLTQNPTAGDRIGENTYKVRIAVKSKGKGKSGGLRVITLVLLKYELDEDITNVFLLALYDKAEFENVSEQKIAERIRLAFDDKDINDAESDK